MPSLTGGDPRVFFRDLPVIETTRLRLRPFASQDSPDLLEMDADPVVALMAMRRRIETGSDAARALDEYRCKAREGTAGPWVVAEKTSNRLIGTTGAWRYEDRATLLVGYSLARAEWGKGYATEALRAGLEALRCLDDLRVFRATVFLENVRSERVLEKCGFIGSPEPCERVHWAGRDRDVRTWSLPIP